MSAQRESSHESLLLPRRLEHTLATATQLRMWLKKGPFPRHRRRVRKRLVKLEQVIDQVQRSSIAEPFLHIQRDHIVTLLQRADQLLEGSLHQNIRKRDLKRLRRDLKQLRRELAETASPLPAKPASTKDQPARPRLLR